MISNNSIVDLRNDNDVYSRVIIDLSELNDGEHSGVRVICDEWVDNYALIFIDWEVRDVGIHTYGCIEELAKFCFDELIELDYYTEEERKEIHKELYD